MKDAIVRRSIEELQRRGLRFSIDEVAKSLKISKKTVYKYFASKEDLAVEIYRTYYQDALRRISVAENVRTRDRAMQIITEYYRSHCMVRDEIFNKYALNENIRRLALTDHARIGAYVKSLLPASDADALMIVVDGTLRELCGNRREEKKVLERLVILFLY